MKYRVEIKDGHPNELFFPELEASAKVPEIMDVCSPTIVSAAFAATLNQLRRQKRPIPMPDGTGGADVPLVLQIKIHLWNWMLENKLRGSDISRRTGLSTQQVARVMNFAYPSNLDRVVEVCDALGAEIVVSVQSK